MEKFEGVSLITVMREIWRAHTFGKTWYSPYTEQQMQDAAHIQDEHLRLLWVLVLPESVRCFRAWDVMRTGTVQNREWLEYAAQDEYFVSAYAMMPSTQPAPLLFGDIYAMDCAEQAARVVQNAAPMTTMVAHSADGRDVRLTPDEADAFESTDDITGFTKKYDETAVRAAVGAEIANLGNGYSKYWTSHVKDIRRERLFFEAEHITRRIESMPEPNGPNQSHFILPAPAFLDRLSNEEKDMFIDYLPFSSLCIVDGDGGGRPQITVYAREVLREREELAVAAKAAKKKQKPGKER